MSKECTEHDLKIALYDTSKGKTAVINFYNDSEILLDCERVTLIREGDILYFHNGNSVKDSVKFSGKHKDILQVYSGYSKVEDMEGFYDLKFDPASNVYYIDKQELLSDYEHTGTIRQGLKYLNYNSGQREKRGDYIMDVTLKESGKKIVETKKQLQAQTELECHNSIIVKALINLLKMQVMDNEDALSTISTLENYI